MDIAKSHELVDRLEENPRLEGLGSQDIQTIADFMKEPSSAALRFFLAMGAEKSPTAQWMANQEYTRRWPEHSCYRNDKFCIAYLFGLDEAKKATSALHVIENSMAGYFEPATHCGFKLSQLLCKLGAMDNPVLGNQYVGLKEERVRKIASALGINDERLADCAESVIRWSINEAYGIEASSEFSAGTALEISQIERTASQYLRENRLSEVSKLIGAARKNIGTDRYKWGKVSTKVFA